MKGEVFKVVQERKKEIVARYDDHREQKYTKMIGEIGLNVKSPSVPNICAKVITFLISSLVS